MGPFIQRKGRLPTSELEELVETLTVEAMAGNYRLTRRFGHSGRWVGSHLYIQCDDCVFRTTGPAGRDFSRSRFRQNTHSMQLIRHRAQVALAQGLWP